MENIRDYLHSQLKSGDRIMFIETERLIITEFSMDMAQVV